MADDVDLRPVTPFYRIRFDDGQVFDCSGDRDAMRNEVARLAPDDLAGYERFMQASATICRVGFEELGHLPFHSIARMVRTLPALLYALKVKAADAHLHTADMVD